MCTASPRVKVMSTVPAGGELTREATAHAGPTRSSDGWPVHSDVASAATASTRGTYWPLWAPEEGAAAQPHSPLRRVATTPTHASATVGVRKMASAPRRRCRAWPAGSHGRQGCDNSGHPPRPGTTLYASSRSKGTLYGVGLHQVRTVLTPRDYRVMPDALNRAGAGRRRVSVTPWRCRLSRVAELEERQAREQSESRVGGEHAQARPRGDR